MVYLDWFGNSFAIFGGFLAFLLAVSEILNPRRTRFQIFFSITLILIGILQLLNAIAFQGVFQNPSLYLFLSLPIVFLLGPIAYLSVQTMVEEEFRFRLITWVSFLPAFVVVIPLLFLAPRVNSFPWSVSFSNQNGVELFFTALSVFSALYSFFFGILILRMLSSIREKRLRLFIWICFFDFSSVAILGILGIGLEFFFLKVSSWVITFVLCLVYYVRKKYADLEETIHVELVRSKYSRSRLGGLEVDLILSELERMMKVEKLFRDDDISLSSVAERVSLSTHQLSELINRKLDKSFFSWLNHYRIEEAKRLLLESDKTVLEIAMEVGFNNRSSFNEAFLKFAQKTPVDFRKSSRQDTSLSYRL
ncbi:helix-turn-helix transcriptional regulator [Leptospira sp. 201903071]|uniref:helix-turn-helix domain-containing protein n=1 Tax=Leptospira ainazelensis TaxID=2810034 RepID=UPI0019626AEC|nr:AraC family transcriptional regulator [Leptospira ainazelensis]MBM9500543.1 helix-turn-helix transcriptional regulator [Leptospira ainazelensis]